MEISERDEKGILVLRPTGRLNNDTSPDFQTKLLSGVESNDTVVVDFSDVEYISSAGLRALMTASKKQKAKGGRLAVADLAPLVKEVFEISRFAQVVQVFGTTADAIAATRAPAA